MGFFVDIYKKSLMIIFMKKMTSLFTSCSGKYWENGAYYYQSAGCYEKRSDGKFFSHFVANMGNLVCEVSVEEYEKAVAYLRTIDGKNPDNKYYTTMHWCEETREVEVYD